MAAAPSFYIYTDQAYDFSSVLECHPGWLFDDQAAEVAALNLLRRHPARVHDPARATLFVVPILPYVSWAAGECMGETHERRMARAAVALRREPYLARRHGRDHLLVTNTFRVQTFGRWLKPLLANATLAWFEQPAVAKRHADGSWPRGAPKLYSLAFWRCTVVVPYLANPFCGLQRDAAPELVARRQLQQATTPPAADGGAGDPNLSRRSKRAAKQAARKARPAGSLFFQGSWAAAANVRRHFTELQSLKGAHVYDVPRGCVNATYSADADDEAAATLDAVASSSVGVAAALSAKEQHRANCALARTRGSRLATARGMLAHEFCLVPRGDTPSSGRLFGALACRCVPLILSNKFSEHFPYKSIGRYDKWTVTVGEGEFLREPKAAIERALAKARPRLPNMRAAMDNAAAELLYDAPNSRVGHNMLLEWGERCAASE